MGSSHKNRFSRYVCSVNYTRAPFLKFLYGRTHAMFARRQFFGAHAREHVMYVALNARDVDVAGGRNGTALLNARCTSRPRTRALLDRTPDGVGMYVLSLGNGTVQYLCKRSTARSQEKHEIKNCVHTY